MGKKPVVNGPQEGLFLQGCNLGCLLMLIVGVIIVFVVIFSTQPGSSSPQTAPSQRQQPDAQPQMSQEELDRIVYEEMKLAYTEQMDERLARLQAHFESGLYKRIHGRNLHVDQWDFLELPAFDQGTLLMDAWMTVHGEDPDPDKIIRVVGTGSELITRYSPRDGAMDLD